jgi:hypothetical protein
VWCRNERLQNFVSNSVSVNFIFVTLRSTFNFKIILYSLYVQFVRHGSAAARLLGMQVRISPGAWMSVSCECCVLSGRDLCVGLITSPDETYRVWCVWVWSWSLDNEEALAHQGLLCHGKNYVRLSISDKRGFRLLWQKVRTLCRCACARVCSCYFLGGGLLVNHDNRTIIREASVIK